MNRNSVHYSEYIAVLVALVLMIFGARSVASDVKAWATPESITVMPNPTLVSPPDPNKPISINDKINHVNCGPDGQVLSAVIDVEISGGVPPYKVDFDPGNQQIPNMSESVVQFTLEGGKSVTMNVRSGTPDGKPMDAKDISAPSHHPDCEGPTPTATPTDTPTPTPTNTPTPTRQRITFTPTPTKANDDESPHAPTSTPTGNSVNPRPNTPTPTSPLPGGGTNPTATPTDRPVDTPTTRPTNTPATNPISTPTSKPTSTPMVAPTSTPTAASSLAECEDGRDNDGDGQIDMQDDKCSKKNDNHEDK